jgi:hypothetical protein
MKTYGGSGDAVRAFLSSALERGVYTDLQNVL